MYAHLAECTPCAAYDAKIRRALVLVRNLPRIEPSTHFVEQLGTRLAAIRQCPRTVQIGSATRLGVVTFGASLILMTYIFGMLYQAEHHEDIVLAPVVALAEPAADTHHTLSPPAFLASVSAGLPLWPMALLAQEAPRQFAESHAELTTFSR